jgi:hypothetical protein
MMAPPGSPNTSVIPKISRDFSRAPLPVIIGGSPDFGVVVEVTIGFSF